MRKNTVTLASILIPIIIIGIASGCAENISEEQPSAETTTFTITNRKVSFITGINNDEIEWSIHTVRRIHSYYSPSLELVEGDAVMLSGEATSSCRNKCVFFEDETGNFQLVDGLGTIYEQQAPVVEIFDEGDGTRIVFSVAFSLPKKSADVSENWGNYALQDPVQSNRTIPNHTVDLSPFNKSI